MEICNIWAFVFKKIASHNNVLHNMKHEAKLKRKLNQNTGRDISDGMAIRLGLNGMGIESRCGRNSSHPSRPALGPKLPPVQCVLGLF